MDADDYLTYTALSALHVRPGEIVIGPKEIVFAVQTSDIQKVIFSKPSRNFDPVGTSDLNL